MARYNYNKKPQTQKTAVENTAEQVAEVVEATELTSEVTAPSEDVLAGYKLTVSNTIQLEIFTINVLSSAKVYPYVKISNLDHGDLYVLDVSETDLANAVKVDSQSYRIMENIQSLKFYSGSRPTVRVEWYE